MSAPEVALQRRHVAIENAEHALLDTLVSVFALRPDEEQIHIDSSVAAIVRDLREDVASSLDVFHCGLMRSMRRGQMRPAALPSLAASPQPARAFPGFGIDAPQRLRR